MALGVVAVHADRAFDLNGVCKRFPASLDSRNVPVWNSISGTRSPRGLRVLNAKATQLIWLLQRTWNMDSQITRPARLRPRAN
jgi:hypothetical protein